MKASILSMQKVENFGSLLQAYSLKRMLEELGCEVSFIDIQRIEEDDCLLEGKVDHFGYECNGSKSMFAKLKKIDRYALNRIRIKKLFNKQIELFEEFRRNELNIKEEDNAGTYDICVIGSDEVFNCNNASSWGFTSQLFGNVKQADKVITYAASCGSTVYKNTRLAVRDKIRKTFNGVSAFSVRDSNTYNFVKQLTTKTIQEHMDPVVVGNFDKEIAGCALPQGLPKKYCVVYSYYNRFHKPEEIRSIKNFCKEKNLELVAVGAPQMWIKRYLVLTPFQTLKLFQQADFVITDTFHGTIFSAKYAKRFAALTRNSNSNKLLNLIQKMGLEKHLIKSLDQLSQVYEITVDKEKIGTISSDERKRTIDYLRNNL